MRRWTDLAFALLLPALLLAAGALTLLRGGRHTTSYFENRALAANPELSARTLWDGSFGEAAEDWLSDHVVARQLLLRWETRIEMELLRRPVVNETVVTGDVLVPFLRFGEYTPEAYRSVVAPIAENYGKLNDWVEEHGGKLLFTGFPEQRVYFEDTFPAYLNNHAAEARAADDIFFAAMEAQGVDCLDMRAAYDAAGHSAAYYSSVDHHFSGRGAYAAYRAILEHLARAGWELPVLTEEDVDLVTLPNPYIGSRNRKLYNLWKSGERAVIAVQRDPVAFTRTDNGAPSEKPLFVLPAAEDLPTTYDLYMGGDFGETVMETGREELPDVLIFGDSFTNALEPLLYASFDETRILDLRYYHEKSLKEYIADYAPDLVLAVGNDTAYYTTADNGAVWED